MNPSHTHNAPNTAVEDTAKPSNFLRQIIEADLEKGTYAARKWAGSPGDASHQQSGQTDPARIRTRFPPEPNGYLHVGHAKSICLNFGLADDYDGICHLRFDDTNPEKEKQEYVDAITDAMQWLVGKAWVKNGVEHLYFASDYFEHMHRSAVHLIEQGLAYVDEQTPDEMRKNRGDFTTPGTDSPYRARSVAENLQRFAEMKEGKLADGAAVLRARIDMAHPNINMRDPAIYRIRRATHHNTGDQWCIYPMYTFAHPVEDALENITHSICTLEFEDQRPFYDWLMEHLSQGGIVNAPPPHQYEFARLNLTYVITSKRKLKQLVDEGHVNGWDDPRMPTIVGLRRRGYTPQAIKLFAERIGVSKADSWIDYSVLEGALRDTLDPIAPRAMAVLDPLKLTITNWNEVMGAGTLDVCKAPVHPHYPELGARTLRMGKHLWIEREDFMEIPSKGYFRLYPPHASPTSNPPSQHKEGNKVRLKYGHVVECTGCAKDAAGNVTKVFVQLIPDTKSGTPGADSIKVKGVIGWVGAEDGVQADVRLYDRLFTDPHPDAGGKNFLDALNPNSLKVVTAMVEPSLAAAQPGQQFQFERHGYFVADSKDHGVGGKVVFNRVTGLKDSWGK
ncbi:MAG: glutamine--tRNA ligase/YqeY domain fusion protein [Brachymonas sp.]